MKKLGIGFFLSSLLLLPTLGCSSFASSSTSTQSDEFTPPKDMVDVKKVLEDSRKEASPIIDSIPQMDSFSFFSLNYNGKLMAPFEEKMYFDADGNDDENLYIMARVEEDVKDMIFTFTSDETDEADYAVFDYQTGEFICRSQAIQGQLNIDLSTLSTNNGYHYVSLFHWTENPIEETLTIPQELIKLPEESQEETYSQPENFTFTYKGKNDNKDYSVDVSFPEYHGKKLPAIITIPGGSFVYADRTYFSDYTEKFNDIGFIHINMDYEQIDSSVFYKEDGSYVGYCTDMDQPTYKDMLGDINTVIGALLTDESLTPYVDPDAISLWGFSAGAQLAMLYACDGYDEDGSTNYKNYIKTIIDEAGAIQLTTEELTTWKVVFSYLLDYPLTNGDVEGMLKYLSPIDQLVDENDTPKIRSDINLIMTYSEADSLMDLPRLDTFEDEINRINETYNYSINTIQIRLDASLEIDHMNYDTINFQGTYSALLKTYCQ